MSWDDYNKIMLALTMWREARGERAEGMKAVGCVVRNRHAITNAGWDHVITKKWQFTSITGKGDPELVDWPVSPDVEFVIALGLAEEIYNAGPGFVDVTNGATHYFNPHIVLPSWASKMVKVASLGNHDFYKAPERVV